MYTLGPYFSLLNIHVDIYAHVVRKCVFLLVFAVPRLGQANPGQTFIKRDMLLPETEYIKIQASSK